MTSAGFAFPASTGKDPLDSLECAIFSVMKPRFFVKVSSAVKGPLSAGGKSSRLRRFTGETRRNRERARVATNADDLVERYDLYCRGMQYLETLESFVATAIIDFTCDWYQFSSRIPAFLRLIARRALKKAGRAEVKVVGRGRESNKSTLELCNNAIGVETTEAYLSALLRIQDDSQRNVNARVFSHII